MRDDWHRAYIVKLGKLGLDIPPDIFERARERLVKGIHHKHAMMAFAAWPLNHWRIDPLDERDFGWFESHYPGWYNEYGAFYEGYRYAGDPDHRLLLTEFIRMLPPNCWTCQGFCTDPDDRRHRVVGGRTRFYCSRECGWLDESNPGRYTSDRNFFDRYTGWKLSQIIEDLGYLRADGHTLIGQPHLHTEGMWTIDDIRAVDFVVESPNILTARELGLPTGEHSGLPIEGDGSVPLGHAHSDLLTGASLA